MFSTRVKRGVISSLDYWDTKGIVHYGAYRSQEDADTIKTMEVNGIKFAFLWIHGAHKWQLSQR